MGPISKEFEDVLETVNSAYLVCEDILKELSFTEYPDLFITINKVRVHLIASLDELETYQYGKNDKSN